MKSLQGKLIRRDFIKLVGLSTAAILTPGCNPQYVQASRDIPQKKTNVILCMTDDQGWGDTGYNGHPVLKTPHLDEMAKVGIKFNRFYSGSTVCLYLAHEAPHDPFQGPDCPPVRIHGQNERQVNRDDVPEIYKIMIEELDKDVKKIVDKVKELGIEENTLIFFFSDNGPTWAGSSGGLRGAKGQTFEGGHRVPAIAYWPGTIPKGVVNTQTIMTMDLMPTMAAMAGAQIDDLQLDGINILNTLVYNQPLPERTLFWRYITLAGDTRKAVRKGKWKLVKNPGFTGLFNLNNDLAESTNLASNQNYQQTLNQLTNELNEWEAQFN